MLVSLTICVPALNWGITNEPNARKSYLKYAEEHHGNFIYRAAGLFVDVENVHLGASPDGLVTCDCCGEGLIEIKCPYKYRTVHPSTVTNDKDFCLQVNEQGETCLSNDHPYYVQVQGQLTVCRKDYCDFIVWTPVGMYVERIIRSSFMFEPIKAALDDFFRIVLLPLLLQGKNSVKAAVFCWCQQEESGRMIACDNSKCAIEWFHFTCAGLARKPRGNWFCSNSCRESFQKS